MKKNKITKNLIIILIVTVFLITISSANAAETNITSTDNLGQTVQNASDGDTINLDNGTYTNNVTDITIDKNLTIQGKNPATTIIDAQELGNIFTVTPGNTLTLINITLTNGNNFIQGGAIYSDGTLTISNCIFSNNYAFQGGGAIYNNGNNLNINNTIFINNSIFGNFGGAIANFGNDSIINNCSFINNDANIGDGGAVYSYTNNVTISNSKFINNNGTYGGAVRNVRYNMTIINSSFFNNTATRYGGGISNGGNMIVSGNTMADNVANIAGNEIYNQDQSMGILNLTYLNNSTITVNNDTNITLYATLTDDMGNPVTGQNISFYVNGIFIGNVEAIEGNANITYHVNQNTGIVPVTGDYAGHDGLDIVLRNGQLLIVSNTTVTNEITLDKNEYQINETVQGKITVTNTGNNTATNVSTKVNFPHSFVLNPSSVIVSHGSFDPITNIWTIGDLAPGEVATMTFTGKFTTAGEHTISIETSGDNFESSTDSVTALVEETPNPPNPTPENETNETTNISAAKAAMKETGIPFNVILLTLLSILGALIGRKQ